MKTKLWLLVALLGFSMAIISPVAQAKNIQNPAYEDLWWAENPTLLQFTQNHGRPLNQIPVVAATSYIPVWQATHNVPLRIENPTLYETSSVLAPTNNSQEPKSKAVTRTGSRGFRMYEENPTLDPRTSEQPSTGTSIQELVQETQ